VGEDLGEQVVAGWQAQGEATGVSDQAGGDGEQPAPQSRDHGLAAADAMADEPSAVGGRQVHCLANRAVRAAGEDRLPAAPLSAVHGWAQRVADHPGSTASVKHSDGGLRTASAVRRRLWVFCRWCADAQIPELTTLAETIETWWSAIEVFLTTGLTNARTEGRTG
jgi:hypothetical protein